MARGGDLRITTDLDHDHWPELTYRGESRRRAFTAGTLLNIMDNGDGKPGGDGIWLSVLVAELTRLNGVYSDTVVFTDTLFTMPAEVKQLLGRLEHIEHIVERCPDNRLKWRLTHAGRKALDRAYSVMKKVESPAVQSRNPIMAWAPDPYPLESLYPKEGDAEPDHEVAEAVGDEPARAPKTGARYEGDGKDDSFSAKDDAKKLAAAFHDEDNDYDLTRDERREIFEREDREAEEKTSTPADTGHGDEALSGSRELPQSQQMMGLGPDHEKVLPRRRIVRRRPTYRQWLTIAHQQPGVMLGAMMHLQYYAPEDVAAAMAKDIDNPIALKLKTDTRRMRGKIKRIGEFAKIVLSGGPEAIWVGKPLVPNTVHEEVVAFHAAGTAGFYAKMIESSSIAMDLYFGSDVTLNDYQSYREFMVVLERENVEQSMDSRRAELVASVRSGDVTSKTASLTDEGEIESQFDQKLSLMSVDEDLERQYGGMSIARQGQDLLMEPGILPKRRCLHVESNGEREAVRQCRRLAAGTSDFCELHGGSVLSDDKELRSLMAANARKLVAMSGRALDTIFDVMANSPNDMTRLQAAKIVLDKSGFADNIDITVAGKNAGADEETPEHLDPAKVVRARLDRLGTSLKEIMGNGESDDIPKMPDTNVIDADVVYDQQFDDTGSYNEHGVDYDVPGEDDVDENSDGIDAEIINDDDNDDDEDEDEDYDNQ